MIEGYIIGSLTATLCIIVGHVLHMRWLDRKLYKPYPKKQPPQQGSKP